MRVLQSLLVLVSFFALSANAAPFDGKSPARDPGVSYKAYKNRITLFRDQDRPPPWTTPADEARVYHRAKLRDVTAWESYDVLLKRFQEIRDVRFLTKQSQPDFKRRSSWLYPDDGCYARAQLANLNILKAAYPIPDKVYIFGDLNVATPNTASGTVNWWYHVAPIVQVNGEKYVLDPSIDPKAPMKLRDWVSRASPTPDYVEIAICSSGSYIPYDNCARKVNTVEGEAFRDQDWMLDMEWQRLLQLQRDPNRELGDYPPWL